MISSIVLNLSRTQLLPSVMKAAKNMSLFQARQLQSGRSYMNNFCTMKDTISQLAEGSAFQIQNEETRKLNKMLIEGKNEEAIEKCRLSLSQQGVQADPLRVRFILAHALKNTNKTSQAIEEFEIFIKEATKQQQQQQSNGILESAHFELAIIYQQRGQFPQSLFHAESAMELNAVLAVPEFIETYISSKEFERGIEFFRNLEKKVPNNEKIPFYEGQLLEAKGDDLKAAVQAYQKAIDLSIDQKNAPANLRIGLILKKQGDYDSSTCFLIKGAEADENNYAIRFNLGQNLRILGEGILGQEHLLACVKMVPDNPQPFYDLALCYEQTGEIDKCIEYLEKNAKEFDNHVETLQRLTNVYAAKGDIEKTVKYINLGVASDPFLSENVDCMKIFEILRKIKGTENKESTQNTQELAQVMELFTKLAGELAFYHSKDVSKMQVLNFFTQLFLINNQPQLAIESEKRLVGIGQNELQHRVNLATLQRTCGNLSAAIEQYKELMRILPEEPNYPYFCAQIYLQSGDLKSAIYEYLHSLRIQDGNDYCLYELSYCYQLNNQQDLHDSTKNMLLTYFPNFFQDETSHIEFIQSLRK